MYTHQAPKQKGFSLIEIMVGLIIGLLVTAVVVSVFRVFEGQKRTTTGNSDAQTNGAIALFNLQRDAQLAGFALPVYGSDFSPFNCPINTTIDHDNNAGTAAIGLSPIVITDGNGANGSDTIAIRFGDSMKGGIAVEMQAGTATNVVQVDNNIGCTFNDVALVINPSGAALNCSMTRVGPSPTGVTATGVTPPTGSSTGTVNPLDFWNPTSHKCEISDVGTDRGSGCKTKDLQEKAEQLQKSLEFMTKELSLTKPLVKEGAASEVDLLRLERSVICVICGPRHLRLLRLNATPSTCLR